MSSSATRLDEKSLPKDKDAELFALIRSQLPEKTIIDQARKLLVEGASLKARSNGPTLSDQQFQNTPCIEAIILGKKEVARFLIRHAIATEDFESLNMQDKNPNAQNNPLFLCIKKNWIEHALLLIKEENIKVNLFAADNYSVLHYAGLLRQDDVIVALVSRDNRMIQAENRWGAKPSDYYLYEFSELDHLLSFDKTTGTSLSPFGLPDLIRARYFEGLEQRSKLINEKVVEFLGKTKTLSEKFKKHLQEYYQEVLANQIDVVNSRNTYKAATHLTIFNKQDVQIEFDKLLAKKIHELEPYPMSDQKRLEEAQKLAKKEFIDDYLKKDEKDVKSLNLSKKK